MTLLENAIQADRCAVNRKKPISSKLGVAGFPIGPHSEHLRYFEPPPEHPSKVAPNPQECIYSNI